MGKKTRHYIIIIYQYCFSRISRAQETPKTAVWGYCCTSRCVHCWPLCVLQVERAGAANPPKRRRICEFKRLAFLSLIVLSNDDRSPMSTRSYSITILLGKTWLVASECSMVKQLKLNILHQIKKKKTALSQYMYTPICNTWYYRIGYNNNRKTHVDDFHFVIS